MKKSTSAVSRLWTTTSRRSFKARPTLRSRLMVVALEERTVPTAYAWTATGAGAFSWNSTANWNNGSPSTTPDTSSDTATITNAPGGNQTITVSPGPSSELYIQANYTPQAGYSNLIVPYVDFGVGTETTLGSDAYGSYGHPNPLIRAGSSGGSPSGDPFYAYFQSQGLGELSNGTNNIEGVWQGEIKITTAGTYGFGTASDDGSVLFVDGTEVVNNNNYQGITVNTGTISLSSGFHNIVIGYFQGGGGLGMQALYAGPDTNGSDEVIPSSVLYNNVANGSTYVSGGLSGAWYDVGSSQTLLTTVLAPPTVNQLTIGDTSATPSTFSLNGALTFAGSGASLTAVSSAPTPISSPLNLGSNTTVANTGTGSLTLSGIITGLASLSLTSGSVGLTSGTNTYAGGTNINGANVSVVGGALSTGKVTINSGSLSVAPSPGLVQGVLLNNGNDWTDPNPGNLGTSLNFTAGEENNYTGSIWDTYGTDTNGDNTTFDYTGYFYTADNTVAFGKSVDDNTYIAIDGQIVLNDTQWNVPLSTGQLNLTANPSLPAGWHSIDVRFGNGGGGAGAVGNNNFSTTYGFGMATDTVSGPSGWSDIPNGAPTNVNRGDGLGGPTTLPSANGNDYINPSDPGNGSLFRTTSVAFSNPFVLNAANSIINVGTDSSLGLPVVAVFSGGISGNGGLDFTGLGSLVLSGTSSYKGTTTVAAGSLVAGSTSGFSSSSTFSLTSPTSAVELNGHNETIGSLAGSSGTIEDQSSTSATLTFGGNNSSTSYGGAFANGTGGGVLNLVKTGSGTTTLTGASTNTGTETLSAGGLIVNGSTGTGTITETGGILGGKGTVGGAVNSTAGTIEAGTTSSYATLTLSGSLSLSATSTLAVKLGSSTNDLFDVNGALSLGLSTLSITPAANLPATSYVIINYTGSLNSTFAGLPQGGVINVGTGANKQTFQISYTGGQVILTKLVPTTIYVYSGWAGDANGTVVTDPILTDGNPATIGTNAFATIGNAGSPGTGALGAGTNITGSTIVINAGTYNENPVLFQPNVIAIQADPANGNTVTIGSLADTVNTAQVQIPTGDVLNVGSDGASTSLSSVILGGGQLVKSGTGSMTLTGLELYQGGTGVTGGVLISGAADSLPSVGSVNVGSGSELRLAGNSQVIGNLAGSGLVDDVSGNSVSLALGGDGSSGSFSGTIEDGSGGGILALTKSGAGTQTLSLTSSSSYSGGLTISGGTVDVGAGNSGLGASSNNVTVNTGGTLNLIGNSTAINWLNLAGGVSVDSVGGGTLSLGAGAASPIAALTISGNYVGAGTLADSANLAFTSGTGAGLNKSSTGTSDFPVITGNINVGSVGLLVLLADTPGDGTELTLSGNISGSGFLELNNNYEGATGYPDWGTLGVGGNNQLTGGIDVADGRLRVFSPNGLGQTATALGVNISGTGSLDFDLTGTNTLSSVPIEITRTNLSTDYPVDISNAAGNTTFGGPIYLVGGITGAFAINGGSSLKLSGPISESGGSGSIETGTSYANSGTGSLILAGVNSYTGSTTVNVGTIVIGGSTTPLGLDPVITVNSGAFLALNGFNLSTPTIGGLGTVEDGASGNSVLTFNGSVSGLIANSFINGSSGALSIVGAGTGTLALTSASTYTGGTTLDSGVINASTNTSFGSGSITLNGGTMGSYQVPGLVTGVFNNTNGADSDDWTDPNPGNLGISLTPVAGEENNYGGSIWDTYGEDGNGDNTTFDYTGQFYTADGTVAFGKSVDDNTLIVINGKVVLNDSQWNVPLSTGQITGLNDGWNSIDIRFGNGGGGAGAVGNNNFSSSYGFGMATDLSSGWSDIANQPLENANTTGGLGGPTQLPSAQGNDFVIPTDPGNGSLFRTAPVVLSNAIHVTTLGGNITVPTGAGSLTLKGAITGSTTSWHKIGGGTLVLPNSNAYAGGTSIDNGAVSIGSAGSLGTGVITLNGGKLSMNGQSPVTAGLLQGIITGNAFDITDPNPATVTGTLPANQGVLPVSLNFAAGESGNGYWGQYSSQYGGDYNGDNTTYFYTGQFYTADGTVAFGKSVDDATEIIINGTIYLQDSNWNQPLSTGQLQVNPGWNNIEVIFGNGGGGAGAVGNDNFSGSYGFGMATDTTVSAAQWADIIAQPTYYTYGPNGTPGTQGTAAGGGGIGDVGGVIGNQAYGANGNDFINPTDPGNATLFRNGGFAISNNIVLASPSSSIEVDGTSSTYAYFNGTITGAAGDVLNKLGGANLVLSGANTYSGQTQITAGEILAGSPVGLSPNSDINPEGNTLDLDGYSNTIGSLSGTGTVESSVLNSSSNNATLTVGADGTSTTFAGSLSNDLNVVKTGSGTMTLTGSDTPNGSFAVNGGTVVVSGTTLYPLGNVTVGSGGTLAGNGTVETNGNVTVAASGTMAGTLSVYAPLVVNGTISPAGAGTVGTITSEAGYAVTLNAGSTYAVDAAGNGYSDSIYASGQITLNNPKLSVTLDAGYTPSVGDTLTIINNVGADPISGTFLGLAQGAPVSIGGYLFKISYQEGSDYSVVLTAIPESDFYAEANWSSQYTIGQTIVHPNPENPSAAAATYGGSTYVSGSSYNAFSSVNAAIQAAAAAATASGNPSTVIVNAGAYHENVVVSAGSLQIILQQGAISFTSLSSAFSSSPISMQNGGTLTVGTLTDTNTYTVASPFSGTGGLDFTGGGSLVLSSGGSYSGPTTVASGSLDAGAAGALSASSVFTISSGATLQLDGWNNSVGSIAGTGTVENNNNVGSTLTIAGSVSSSFSGTIKDGPGSAPLALTMASGSLTLSGTETFTGGISFNGGTVSVANISSLGASTWEFDGGSLTYSGTTTSSTAPITINSDGGNISLTATPAGSSTLTLSGLIAGSGTLTETGSNTLLLNNSGDSGYTGNITVTGGTFQLGDGSNVGLAGTGNITLGSAGTLIFDEPTTSSAPTSIVNNISGPGAVVNEGTGGDGAVVLNGTNAIAGTVTVEGGQFQLGSSTSPLGSPSSITVDSGGQFYLGQASSLTFSSPLSLAGTGYSDASGPTGALRLGTSSNIWSGPITIAAGGASISGVGGIGTISGPISGGALEVGTASPSETVTVFLTDSNSYTSTTVDTGAVLIVGNGGTTGSLGTGTTLVINGTLVYNLSGTTSFTNKITDPAGTGAIAVQAGGTLTLGSGANVSTGNVYVSDNYGGPGGSGTLNIGAGAALNDSGSLLVGDVAGKSGTVNQMGGTVNANNPGGLNLLNNIYASPAAGYQNLLAPIIDFTADTTTTIGNGATYPNPDGGAAGGGQAGDPFYPIYQLNGLPELPYSNGPTTDFGAIFTGQILVPTTGSYVFSTESDDGSVLYINGKIVVNNDFNQGMPNANVITGTVNLTAGFATIEIAYYKGGGNLGLQAAWQTPGQTSLQVIPTSVLYNNISGSWQPGGLSASFYNFTEAAINNNDAALNPYIPVQIGAAGSETSSYNLSGGTFSSANAAMYVGSAGNGSFNQSGGTATLQGVVLAANGNSLTGIVDLTNGILNIGSSGFSTGAAPSTPLVELGGGTLVATASFTDSAQTTLTGSNEQNLNTQSYVVQITSQVTGTGGINQIGTGTLVLSGINSYSGGTTVNTGVVNSSTGSSLGTGTITEAGGTLQLNTSAAIPGPASISGFNGGTGWTTNENNSTAPASFNGGDLTITTAQNGNANTAWYNEPVYYDSFTSSFTYSQSAGLGGADGFTFTLQNEGLNAVGAGGGDLAYQGGNLGATNFAVAFNIYDGHNQGYAFLESGTGTGTYNNLGNEVSLTNGEPVNITISYNGTVLTLVMSQDNGLYVFTASDTVNLSNLLGGNGLAYIGFTGATGGANSQQDLSNFSYAAEGPANPNVYPNNVVVPAGDTGTTNVNSSATYPTITMGTLSIGTGGTENVTGSSTTAASYGLIFGQTNLAGSDTINVVNGTSLPGTVTLGSLTDTSASTLTVNTAGTGTLVLTAAASLVSGSSVYVGGGTLNSSFATALGTSGVTVASGASLVGYGSAGTVTWNGTVAPTVSGTSTGTFNTGAVSIGSTGVYSVTVNGTTAGTNYSQINSQAGIVSISSSAVLDVTLGYAPSQNDSYTIIQSANAISGNFSGLTQGSLYTASYQGTPYTFQISYLNDAVTLTDVIQTAVEVGSSNNPSPVGTPVTFTADIFAANNASVTGTVTFYDGAAVLGTEPVSGNTATFSTSSLSPGMHDITATYNPTPGSGFLTNTGTLNPEQDVTSTGPTVSSVVINPNQGAAGSNTYLGNSRVLQIQVTFSEPVDISSLANAFKLTNIGTLSGGASNGYVLQSAPTANTSIGVITVTPSGSSGTTTSATLTFSNYSSTLGSTVEGGSLTDGLWSLSVSGVTSSGTPMSAAYTTPSGSPILRLFGDYTGAGVVSSADLGPLGTTYGLINTSPAFIPAFDVDGNGEIDSTDLGRFGQNFGLTV